MTKFLCGVSRADITPPVGTLLFGYNPHQVSTSIHDRLAVTAAAFSDGETTAVLVTADVCEIQTALSDEIRKKAGEAAGIPRQNILLSATHTHSAPNVTGMEGWGDVDRPYVDAVFLPAIVQAVKEAVGRLEPAVLGIAETESRVGVNRRELKRGGYVNFGQNPWGPFDPTMTVIAVKSADGRGLLNLVHYGCHGTAAGCNHEISRDWSGMMVDRMERETGVMTAYWQGACGDTGPRISNGLTTGDITYVEELGSLAAMDAVRAWRQIRAYHVPALAVFHGTVRLPCAPLPDEETVLARLAAFGDPASLINIQAMEYGHWRDVLAAIRDGITPPDALEYDTTLVALGDILWIPHPFEMFTEITLRLRQYAPYAHVLSLSTTNGTNEYLPTKGEMLRGGYEVDCFRYGHVFPMTDDADEHIIEENLRILGV
ncbi:MAG: neutral/alkaline non-lysosomal ceramidase N-terminal domain-containing protein [Clostridia bacterium]|nr:neutral/alkaline non-lysosomal ceramidase N-terminal domain-containing protein [Clostridia bacterium]